MDDLVISNSVVQKKFTSMLLQVDDLENHNQRNNIHFRGILENVEDAEIGPTIRSICNNILGKPQQAELIIDRVHRVTPYRSHPGPGSRDVLCRIHFFNIKDEIMRRAWQLGQIEYAGVRILILLDISRNTPWMRGCLGPLLDQIKASRATYSWGHQFHLRVKRDNQSFLLHTWDQVSLFGV